MGLGLQLNRRVLVYYTLGSVLSTHKANKTKRPCVRSSRRMVSIHLKGSRILLQIVLPRNLPGLVLLLMLQTFLVLAPVSLERVFIELLFVTFVIRL